MAADEFSFKPSTGASGEVRHRRTVAMFGDGYSQAVGDGINRKMQDWPLLFVGGSTTITPIRDFLDLKAGTIAFTWTPPLGTQGIFRADPYTLTAMGKNNYQLAVTLKQAAVP